MAASLPTPADVIYAFSPQQATSPEPEGAWQFIKWLATNPDAQAAMIVGGVMPALQSAQQTPAIAGDGDAQLVLQALKVARTPQDAIWEPEVAASLEMDVQKALNGQASAQQALAAASALRGPSFHPPTSEENTREHGHPGGPGGRDGKARHRCRTGIRRDTDAQSTAGVPDGRADRPMPRI